MWRASHYNNPEKGFGFFRYLKEIAGTLWDTDTKLYLWPLGAGTQASEYLDYLDYLHSLR